MREIILRSYNEDKKQFYYFIDGCYYSKPEKFTLISGKKISNKISERICKEFNWDNSEQFTGLTDKNGVKIFEGDKVPVKDHNYKPSVVYEGFVEWTQTSFMLNTGSLRNSHWNSGSKDIILEVIENIHNK